MVFAHLKHFFRFFNDFFFNVLNDCNCADSHSAAAGSSELY